MNRNEKWLQWAVELQSLAQAGLTYGKDAYDLEPYQRIREIAAEIISHMADIPVETVTGLFCSESGYQTPKLDTRAAIFQEGKILLVRENDGRWSLPVYAYGVCKVFVQCTATGGKFEKNIETTECRYFSPDELPELAEEKNTSEQIKLCFAAYHSDDWEAQFD